MGSGRGYSVLQIINAISKKINLLNIKNFLIISPRRLGDNARLVCNYRKAFKFLKWKPKKSNLKKIISDEIIWQKNNKFKKCFY